jgi:hypothetical protein
MRGKKEGEEDDVRPVVYHMGECDRCANSITDE